jgi:hypothetical protein
MAFRLSQAIGNCSAVEEFPCYDNRCLNKKRYNTVIANISIFNFSFRVVIQRNFNRISYPLLLLLLLLLEAVLTLLT